MEKTSCWKAFTWFAVMLLIPLAVEGLNTVILEHFHELAYYYTPRGILLTMAVCTAELPVVLAIMRKAYDKAAAYFWED